MMTKEQRLDYMRFKYPRIEQKRFYKELSASEPIEDDPIIPESNESIENMFAAELGETTQ